MSTKIETPEVKIAEIAKEVVRIDGECEQFVTISSPEEVTEATKFLSMVKGRYDRTEELRTFFTKPLLDQKRNIDALFKEQTAPLLAVITKVKRGVSNYTLAEMQKAREKEEKARIAQEKKNEKREAKGLAPDLTPAPLAPTPETTTHTAEGKSTTSTVWKFEVESLKDVPKKYMTVDEKKIRQAVKEGEREIKGVRIYQDVQVSVSSNV